MLAVGVAIAQFWPNWTPIVMVAGDLLRRAVARRLCAGAEAGRRKVGLHPVWLMFALFAFGYLFGFVGLLVAVPLAATIGVLAALCAAPISRKPDLHRRTEPGPAGPCRARAPDQRAMNVPRQLALALDHAESFAREDFLAGPSNEAALGLIERWPDWPDRALALVGPEGAGKSHLAAIWAENRGRATLSPRARSARPICRSRSRPARWWSRMLAERGSTSARCFICSISRARRTPIVLITARTRAGDLAHRAARSCLAAARASGGRADARPTTRCCAP